MTESMTKTASLFGSNDHALDASIRRAIAHAMRHSSKSREQLAEELSQRTGCHVSANVLNAMAAESKRLTRFPLCWVVPFCEVTGDDTLARLAIPSALRQYTELGERVVRAQHEFEELTDLRRMLSVRQEAPSGSVA
jgi:hypothetical protein